MADYKNHHQHVLDFWFGLKALPEFKIPHEKWFKKDPDFDAKITKSFGPLLDSFDLGLLENWKDSAWSTLGLIILLDQFPRNIFRNTAKAFAYDSHALKIAKNALQKNFDAEVPPLQRVFYYLPLEHSENLDDQRECVRLFKILEKECPGFLIYAEKHLEIIERFGRFPHRNDILKRPSTKAEEEFLKEPGSSF